LEHVWLTSSATAQATDIFKVAVWFTQADAFSFLFTTRQGLSPARESSSHLHIEDYPMNWILFATSASEVARELLLPKRTANVDICVLDCTPITHGLFWSINQVSARNNSPLWHLAAGQSKKVIVCNLIECIHGHWGYQQIEEAFHPSDYSCPLEYLDKVPIASNEWRNKVRLFHAQRCKTAQTLCSSVM